MSILHGDLVLSKAQAETTAAAHDSTNVIDLGAAHVGYGRKLIISVAADLTSNGSATVAFDIATGSTTACSTVLHAIAAAAYSGMDAGDVIVEYMLPWEVDRYVKVTYTIADAALTGGSFNAWIDDVRQTNGI